MKITKSFLAAAILGVLPSCWGQFDSVLGTPCTVTLSAGDNIQAAIDSASNGDVVCLGAGTYAPLGTIDINKPLELRGPQSNVDPRTSCGSARTDPAGEAVVDGASVGTIFVITADDVTIDGLTIQNQGSFDDMIESPSNADISRVNIRYSIITEATDEGIQLRDCADCVVEYNLVFNIGQDGINMCCGSTNGSIQFNEVHGIGSENAAIYVYDSEAMSINDNYVYDVTDNDGIKMGGSDCDGDKAPNGFIGRNVVRDVVQDGITVYSSGTTVMDNEIYNSNSENGALYIQCSGTQDVTVMGNVIHDNGGSTVGIQIGNGIDPTTASIRINENCIQGNNEGMVNGATAAGIIDATQNWWGAVDGPSGPGGSGSGDSVSTNVDFSNFLTTAPEKCQPGNLFSENIGMADFVPPFCPTPIGPPPPIEFPDGCEGDYVKPEECLGVLTMLSGNCVLYFDDEKDIQELGASNEMDCIGIPSCSATGGEKSKKSSKASRRDGRNRDLRKGMGKSKESKKESKKESTNTGPPVACNYNSKVPSTVGLSLSPENDEVCGNMRSFKIICTDGPPVFSVTCSLDGYPFVSAGNATIEVMPEGLASTTATYALQPFASFTINDAGMTTYDVDVGCADKICVDGCLALSSAEDDNEM